LNAFRYRSFFGGRAVIFVWYTWRAAVQGRWCNVHRDVKCDRLGRPRSFPNVIPKDTRDIWPRDIQSIEQGGFSIIRTTLRGKGYPHLMGA
jgi:hypothetical protein